MRKHHVVSKRYVASGTKQLRILVAIYDDDATRNAKHEAKYLRRSADLLRAQVKPGASSRCNAIDKHIRMCMTRLGPCFMSLGQVKKSRVRRRVGNVYYDRSFANAFMCNAVAGRGSFRQIAAAFASSSTRGQGQLSSLLPEASHSFWCNVLEDLLQSPQMATKLQSLLNECYEKEEFRYISIDATVKCMMKILGQASFNESQDLRDAAALPDAESVYKLLTVRGRTNAVLALRGIRSEASHVVADATEAAFSPQQRQQVKHVASDCPSPEMFARLHAIFPNLKSVGLDAMHIVMVYEQNFNNKRTQGSKWLASVMNKFRVVDCAANANSFGPMYTGVENISYSAEEKWLGALLAEGSMPEVEAISVLDKVDPDQPWRTEADFLEAIAAICSLFFDELQKVTLSGATLHRLLINLTVPGKIQWLFNDTRYRHTCPAKEMTLLPSGTTSNESLHHEIKTWFRETVTWLQCVSAAPGSFRSVKLDVSRCTYFPAELSWLCIDQRWKPSSSSSNS